MGKSQEFKLVVRLLPPTLTAQSFVLQLEQYFPQISRARQVGFAPTFTTDETKIKDGFPTVARTSTSELYLDPDRSNSSEHRQDQSASRAAGKNRSDPMKNYITYYYVQGRVPNSVYDKPEYSRCYIKCNNETQESLLVENLKDKTFMDHNSGETVDAILENALFFKMPVDVHEEHNAIDTSQKLSPIDDNNLFQRFLETPESFDLLNISKVSKREKVKRKRAKKQKERREALASKPQDDTAITDTKKYRKGVKTGPESYEKVANESSTNLKKKRTRKKKVVEADELRKTEAALDKVDRSPLQSSEQVAKLDGKPDVPAKPKKKKKQKLPYVPLDQAKKDSSGASNKPSRKRPSKKKLKPTTEQ
ncbi:hypothetical protein DICA3_D06392 [Diutina catenulata]